MKGLMLMRCLKTGRNFVGVEYLRHLVSLSELIQNEMVNTALLLSLTVSTAPQLRTVSHLYSQGWSRVVDGTHTDTYMKPMPVTNQGMAAHIHSLHSLCRME